MANAEPRYMPEVVKDTARARMWGGNHCSGMRRSVMHKAATDVTATLGLARANFPRKQHVYLGRTATVCTRQQLSIGALFASHSRIAWQLKHPSDAQETSEAKVAGICDVQKPGPLFGLTLCRGGPFAYYIFPALSSVTSKPTLPQVCMVQRQMASPFRWPTLWGHQALVATTLRLYNSSKQALGLFFLHAV